MSFDPGQVNSGFIERLDAGETQKAAASAMSFIKDRIRESSFTDMIVPNERVVRSDLQRSVDHDTLVKIVDIEPDSRAMSLTFRGQPDAKYVNGKRYAITFWTISSLKFEIVEQELLAYEMPVTQIIEKNSLKDMVEVKDREFLTHVNSCIEAMQEEGNGGAVSFARTEVLAGTVEGISKVKGSLALAAAADDFVSRAIQRPDIVEIKKLLKRIRRDSSGNIIRAGRLRPAVMLMTESDADDFDQWTQEDMGDRVTSETVVEGWTYNKAVGLRIIRTIKNDILTEGNVYVFTAPEFFGRNYTLNDVKFYVDKIANRIFWQAWMDIGMGFGNIAACVKLELYSGAVTPGATDTGFESAIPSDEEDLGVQNNKAADGLTFPAISVF
jgi:hypothetical protein